ncbi:MAG: shikimate dehydrogenase [bacterium]
MRIDATTRVCAVIGNPVEHSLSPVLHNTAFENEGLAICYVAFRVEDLAAAMAGARALNLLGLSVTIPHKIEILQYLDEVDETARQIGSVNTVLNRDGKLIGFNSDGMGAVRALQDAQVPLADRRILVLGSGGAARAIAFSVGKAAPLREMELIGIEKDPCRRLAEDLQRVVPFPVRWHEHTPENLVRAVGRADGIIHCTPVGMSPHPDASLIDGRLFRPEQFVFDIVYTPLKTRLLREAEAAGCRIIPGLEMFLRQAVFQFECWTGRKAPLDVMREVVLESLA